MLKTLIAKQTFLATSVLLIACLAHVHESRAAQQDSAGTPDPHDQARLILRWGNITPLAHSQTFMAVDAARSVYLDPNEQVRRLLLQPLPAGTHGPAFEGALLIVNSHEVDAHKRIEHLLSAPLPY